MNTPFREQFEKVLKVSAVGWVKELRQSSLDRFEELGVPTVKQEAWKYTNLKKLEASSFYLAPQYQPNGLKENEVQKLGIGVDGFRLTFVNGQYAQDLSSLKGLPPGVQVQTLSEVLQNNPDFIQSHLSQYASTQEHPFVALNTAFLQEGAVIHLSHGVVLEKPIELLFLTLPSDEAVVAHPRILIVAESMTQASIVETFYGLGEGSSYFNNAVTELVLEEGAIIDHYKVQRESEGAFHLASLDVCQKRNSQFRSHNISLGSALARHDIRTVFDAEGADCTLNGLYLVSGAQHVDNQTSIDHAKPHCSSRELYKGILDGKAQGVFNGRIVVRPDAQKTNSSQSNKNLLLSNDALVNTKPLLEIFADDVKCSHGATIGRLDENQIFYLRSRGIEKNLARQLLTYAFASEVVQEVKLESLKARLEKLILERLHVGTLSVGGVK